jgi:hypothetical protein
LEKIEKLDIFSFFEIHDYITDYTETPVNANPMNVSQGCANLVTSGATFMKIQ